MAITDGLNRNTDHFTENFMHMVFLFWVRSGRPSMSKLANLLPYEEGGKRPHQQTLSHWKIKQDWDERADELDRIFAEKIDNAFVGERIKMLREHAQKGREFQEMALNRLDELKENLTANQVLRLLSLGLELERQSVGIPDILEKVSVMDSIDVKDRIAKLVRGNPVAFDQITEMIDVNGQGSA